MILGGLVSTICLTASKGVLEAPDYTMDAVDWTDVDSSGKSGTTNVQQITGVNRTITLEISWTGNLGYFYIGVNSSNSYGGTITVLDVSPKEIQVQQDKYVAFRLDSIGLQDNLTRSVTVKNKSDGNTTVDTFTMDVDGSTTKTDNYAFNLFWDNEVLVNRYDTTASNTTANGWFVR